METRLRKRAQNSDKEVLMRMEKAEDEMRHYCNYDYVIVNNDLEDCVRVVKSILWAERFRTERQHGIEEFVKSLGV